MLNRSRVLKAWLRCKVNPCKNKNHCEIEVSGLDNKTVKHIVSKDKISESGKAVLVVVFRDKDGYWIRFPTTGPYRPFRVRRKQLKKAR